MSGDQQRAFISHKGVCVFLVLCLFLVMPLDAKEKGSFPRLMGMNIGAKNYDDEYYKTQLAKLDVVILGFTPGWHSKIPDASKISEVVIELKSMNPNLLVGQYTILNESYSDPVKYIAHIDKITKINTEKWWLLNRFNNNVSWARKYPVYEVNFLEWAGQDGSGMRYPEWIAKRDYDLFFKQVPEIDIWYFDNVMKGPRISSAKWKNNDEIQSGSDQKIKEAYRRGHANEWKAVRKLDKNIILMGNVDNDLSYSEYDGKLQAVFLEGLMGKRWSIEKRKGWREMMRYYFNTTNNIIPPRIVGFNVAGTPEDDRFFRYAFTSCLLGDGYFSFTDEAVGYSDVVWFDEYGIDLGEPMTPPVLEVWKNSVYKREFEKGVVLVNPSIFRVNVKLKGIYTVESSDKSVISITNSGNTLLRLDARDGVILAKKIPTGIQSLSIYNLRAMQ